ncbi:MAG TPA: hypothetical protein VG099_12270 [Gemmataceae bacterium]|jgi:hypothetical protein|nr:hypothetical protein [Gemmataceae bacterium]
MKTTAIMLIFGTVAFFISAFVVDMIFEANGPFMGFIAAGVGIPLGTALGVGVGFCAARFFQY